MRIPQALNVVAQCRKYQVPLWACPQFLFIIMGALTITAVFITSMAANRFSGDPAVSIISVTVITLIFIVIGHTVVMSFERLAEAQRSQTEFVSVVSHQLRTPLSAVRWQLDVAEERLRKGNTDVRSLINTVQGENNRVIKLVSALLQVNRIQERRIGLHMERLSLWSMTEKVAARYKTFADALRIELVLERKENHPFYVLADEGKLRWVLENLIDNAIRYSPDGGRVTVRLSDEKMARWEIDDQGIGIPKEAQKGLFQKFFRAANAQQVQTEGSGLGLFIVKSYVEAMGGKMRFTSKEGAGSKFWFTLPLAEKP